MSNYVALGILGVSGLAINFLVGGHYGAEALGVFNQAYAVYVLVSQIAVMGIHHSALKYVAEYSGKLETIAPIIRSSLILSTIFGSISAVCTAMLADILGMAFSSEKVAKAIVYASPGLLFFAVNKVNFAIINGLRRMKLFAVGQAARFILIVGFVFWASIYELGPELLTLSFTIGEIVLAAFLTPFVISQGNGSSFGVRNWMMRHIRFGAKSVFGSFFMEANLRIDVLMLGILSSDVMVGIYSFAATFIEGFYNFLVVLRNNVNPLLVEWMRDKRPDFLSAFVRKTRLYIFPLTFLAGSVLIVLYPSIVSIVSNDLVFEEGWLPLTILVIGIVFYSGTLPFDFILLQMGRPGTHTLFVAAVMASNILLNLIAIPLIGMIGAAIATATSMLLGAIYLNMFLKHCAGHGLADRNS